MVKANPISSAYFFPCALIEDFTNAQLSSDTDVAEKNKWSTVSDTLATTSINDIYTKNNFRSLKVAYTASAARTVVRGVSGTDYDISSVNNPLGADPADFSSYDHLGMWIYSTLEHDDGEDILKLGYYYDGGSTFVSWNSSAEKDKWRWLDESIDLSNTDVSRFAYTIESTSAGDFYFNNLVAFKRSTSNVPVYDASDKGATTVATGTFDWSNGLGFALTGFSADNNTYNVSGLIFGTNYEKLVAQLRAMETKGLVTSAPIRNPQPKCHSVQDFGYTKTYLFMTEVQGPGDTASKELYVEPVVIKKLTFNHQGGSPHIIPFSCTLVKYGGI